MTMRALLLTVGSRGDVQPFVALALRLRAAGHDAVLAAPAAFSDLAGAHDVPFVPLDLDMSRGGGRSGQARAALVRFCRSMGRRAGGVLPGATTAAGPGADIVVHHPVLPVGQHLAEWLGVPAVLAPPLPALVPTRDFGSAAWPCRAPGIVNRPSYRAARLLTGAWCRRDIDHWRREVLALPPRPGRHDPLLSCDGTPVTVCPRSAPTSSRGLLTGRPPRISPGTGSWPPRPAGRRRAGWPSSSSQ